MDKHNEGKSSRHRWKDEHRNPKLYDERTDTAGVSSQNGKNSSSKVTIKIKSEPKNDIVTQLNQNLPEDLRISKLLRRLECETTITGMIEICVKLKTVVKDQSNAGYIKRSFDMITNSIVGVMKDCSEEALSHVCEVYGMMGFVVRNDFPVYKAWICKTYKSTKILRVAMMNALEKTLCMDSNELRLSDQIGRLLELLRDFLEQTDDYRVFMAITQVLMVIAGNYNARFFKQHFTNFVDIIIGWMMESDQESKVKIHCASVLQSFKTFWQNDTKFTLELLGQLLEDIEGCKEKLDDSSEDAMRMTIFKEYASFVGCLNAIIKSIYFSSPEALVNFMGREMTEQIKEKVFNVAESALREENCIKDVVLVINEFSLIMLNCRRGGIEVGMEQMENMVELQLEHLKKFTENEIASLLYFICEYIKEFKSELSVRFVQTLFGLDSILVNIVTFNNDSRVKCGLIKIYHDIMALKNVPVLQAAYKCLIDQFGANLKRIPSLRQIPWITEINVDASEDEKSIVKAQYALNFTLTALAKLATVQNSIIVMYSLSPSILEVLLALEIWRSEWNEFELIQYSILLVISEHCLKNNNFLSSSTLLISKSSGTATSSWLADSSPTESPASQHFKLILQFIEKLLRLTPSLKQFKLLLDWLDKIIQQTSQFAEQLKDNQSFLFIMKRINQLTIKYNDEVLFRVANCDDSLYSFDVIHPEIYTSIAEACGAKMCSVNPEIRRRYSFIHSRLPIRFTVEQAKSPSGVNVEMIDIATEMENWHLSLGSIHGGELRAQYFNEFIKQITYSTNADNIDEFILNAFKNCWFNGTDVAEKYKEITLKDVRTLCSWIQWESARFCVNNKLRTPLGKAQETFIKIEGIIREHARILALKNKSKLNSYKHVLANQRNVRILLGFMENLEKAIYNAAEGSAFAIPAPEKPARTFFRLNAQTCNDWFNRNRLAIHQLALHCMELEMVIRCSMSILKEMVAAGKVNDTFFDQILLSLTWALLRNFESDSLVGLYIWVKNVSNRKLHWIKMAAEQAAGHREIAAEGYSRVLNDEKLDTALYDFIVDQRKYCYYCTGDIMELLKSLIDEEAINYQPATTPTMQFTREQCEKFLLYDKTKDLAALEDLSLWDILDDDHEVSNNFSVHHLLSKTSATLGLGFLNGSDTVVEKLSMSWEIIQTLLQECIRTNSQEHLKLLIFFNHLALKLSEMGKLSISNNSRDNIESLEISKKYGSLTMYYSSAWSEFIDAFSEKGEQQNINLKLMLVASARKELNFRQCYRELSLAYKCIEYRDSIGLPIGGNESLPVIKEYLMSPKCGDVWSENVARAVYEHCKMLYVVKNQHIEAIQFAATAAMGIKNRLLNVPDANLEILLNQQCVKFYIKISEYLQNETEETAALCAPLKILVQSINDEEIYIDDKMPLIDNAVGKLLQSGTKLAPELNKIWSTLANWCYRWGRKMVESKTSGHPRTIDSNSIMEIVPDAQAVDIENILTVLNEQQIIGGEEEDIGPNESSSTEIIETQLRMVPLLRDRKSDVINGIIKLWKQTHRDVFKYYEMCASAYFKFLLISQPSSSTPSTTSVSNDGNSSVVIATLRLLRLIVKHALALQEVLEEGLASTPSDPWKVIIPQLFSRLNHHEPYVRKRVSELLCRVAKDSPHLIIFPTVVGSQDKSMNVSKITHHESRDDEENSSLTFCFNSLLDTLSMQSPTTVSQVQLFVRELRRISLLWDELWLLSMGQVYAENAKKFQNFEIEFQSNEDKSSEKIILFTEKHRLLMRPVIFVLERLHEWTSQTPETNNEKSFQEKFSHFIEESIGEMKRPFDANEPLAAFGKFKSLYQLIQQRVHKRMNHTLRMSDISPILANMRDTQISMPGLLPPSSNCDSEASAVYIQSVDEIVQILPTKTKPKKLVFYGSDGKRYTYLFKGVEDLHLDERIMQFLSIANLMMKKSIDSDGKVTNYRAHHYSVIPLGLRSGLISWVDGVTPIFSIYKRWQQREAANPRKDKQYVVMRPSEMFYKKITPLLKEHGMKVSDNRKDWPLFVQRKVFEELKAETPKDLLAKEFWCTASTAAHWRQIVRNYSVSLAVMSVIGYTIGLGDRHLDNVLVKLNCGDIVHIDYNVCFEKGKTLRVPEKIPFRMTQNIEEALGLTGVEGTFRLCCEHVLKSLKRGRETLLTLLEAFVYDPLVDWTIAEDSATGGLANLGEKGNNATSDLTAARKQLEREVTRDTLAIRFTEIKNDWTQNRDDVYNQLLMIDSYLSDLTASRNRLHELESRRNVLSKQISLVRDVEALGSAMHSHSLNTLSQRYAILKKKRNDVEVTRNILIEKAIEAEKMIEDYVSFVNDKNVIGNYVMDMKTQNVTVSEFEVVKEFLENSNQSQVYVQGDQLRKEMDIALIQRSKIVESSMEMMLQYYNVMRYYPKDHVRTHRLSMYSSWCRSLVDNKSQEFARQIAMSYHTAFSDPALLQELPKNVLAFNFQLQTFLTELNYQLQGNYQRYQQFVEMDRSYNSLKEEFYEFLHQKNTSVDENNNLITSELVKMTKRFLTLEASTCSASGTLADLKINDRWYVDEIRIQTSFLANVMDDNRHCKPLQKNNPLYVNSLECLRTIVEGFEIFERAKYDFQLNVIPQALNGVISQDRSVLDVIKALSGITKAPIDELIMKLEEDFISCIRNPNQKSLLRAAELSEAYNNIYAHYQANNNVDDVGGKLFMLFHETFEELCRIAKKIMSYDKALNLIPDDWNSISEIQQSKSLFISPVKTNILMTLDQLLMVKRVQTMIEFFSNCLQIAWAFKGSGGAINFDVEFLSRPLKVFITDLLKKCVLGRATYSLSLVICCLQDTMPKYLLLDQLSSSHELTNSHTDLMYCEKFFMTLEEKFRRQETGGFYQKLIHQQSEYIKHITYIISAHHWLHEEYFLTTTVMPPYSRANILLQAQNFIPSLSNWNASLGKIEAELKQCTIVVFQRLKWAVGANPLINDLMNKFESISHGNAINYERESVLAEKALKYILAIINYEMLRVKTQKAIVSDEEFLRFLHQWENVCLAERSVTHTVSPIEEGLIELLNPEGSIDSAWIENVTSLIDDMINQVHSEIDSNEKTMVNAQDNLHLSAHKLRNLMSIHHRIFGDIKNLLKNILKYDECGSGGNELLREYFTKYKNFIDNITELHGNVLSKDFTDVMMKQIKQQVERALHVSNDIYNELFSFEKTLLSNEERCHSESNRHSIEYPGSPMKKAANIGSNINSNQKEQRKNVYAVSVWRRIRSKLEGRDPDPNKCSRVQEQVDFLIREAQNQDNLALLYEGFTAWV